jgi:hypothetical protein
VCHVSKEWTQRTPSCSCIQPPEVWAVTGRVLGLLLGTGSPWPNDHLYGSKERFAEEIEDERTITVEEIALEGYAKQAWARASSSVTMAW